MSWRTIIVWGSSCALAGVALVALSAVGSGAGFVSPSIRLRVDQVIDQFVIDLEDSPPEDTPRYNLIALADLNRDNIVDLVTVDTDQDELNLNFGSGSGLFEDPVTIEAVDSDDNTFSPIAVVPGDFTGPFDQNEGRPDGNIDLALVDDFGAVTIMIGDGDGNFATPDQLLDELGTVDVFGAVAADFDGNGDLDLALADQDQVAFVCNEDGVLQLCSETYVVVDNEGDAIIVDLAVGDFDNDDRPDVAALASNRGLVYPIFSDGGGRFTLGLGIVVPGDAFDLYASITATDFNNDGFDDVVTVSDEEFGDNAQVSLGAANRNFQRILPFETVPASSITAGNFSEDSDADLLFSTSPRLAYIVGDGTGDFSTSLGAEIIIDRGIDNRFLSDALVLKSADLNNDGLPDLVGLVRDGTQLEVALNVVRQPTQTPVIPTPTASATPEASPSPTATVEPTTSPTAEPSPSRTAEPTRTGTVRPTIAPFDSDDDGCAVVAAREAIAPSWLGLCCAILLAVGRRRRRR